MELQIDECEGVKVVRIPANHLDAGNATEFRGAISAAITGEKRVLIDLSGVQFVDSSGLGALLACLRQLAAEGGRLRLCGIGRTVRSLFELVRMHRVFDICVTRESALAAFRAEAGKSDLPSGGAETKP